MIESASLALHRTSCQTVRCIALPLLTVCAVMLCGCANHSHQKPTTQQDLERGSEAAIAAVKSATKWKALRAKRITHGPFKIDPERVRYRFYEAQTDTTTYDKGDALIIYTVPTGIRFFSHSTLVDVAVCRDTFKVVGMYEYYYP